MSNFALEDVTSPFTETDSSIKEVASVVHPPLYANLFAEIVVEEETVTRVECLEARSESNDEEEMIDVVGGGEVGMRSGAESEGFTFVDALRRANLIAASVKPFLIRLGCPLVSTDCTITFGRFYVNTHWPLCVPCILFDAHI